MSGRRSHNPRWLAWGIAICFVASAGVGQAPAHATAASSTISTVEAPRLGSTPSAARGEPRPNIKFSGPQFVVQPRLVGRNLVFVVKVNPHRTADNNSSAKADILRGRVDVSRRGVAIRTVGLDPKTRAKQLIFTTKFKERVVRRAGRIEYQIRLPLAVARSLAVTSVRNRTTRVRVVLVHAKDTKPSLRWRETLMLAQSSLEPLPTSRSLAATSLLWTAPRHNDNVNVNLPTQLYNNTPFTLQVSTQATQCVDVTQWNETMSPGQSWWSQSTILVSGNPNGLSTWQNLSQSAVTALKGAAIDAGQDAIKEGPESFSPEGAITNGVNFATNFMFRFITDLLLEPSCSDTPATWVVSAVATGLPQPLWQGANGGGSWAVASDAEPFQSGPVQTTTQLASTLGAQTSVQWNWNGGNIAANGPGASYFSGGLIQTQNTTITGDGGLDYATTISYQNNAQTSYGPIQTSNVTLTASSGTDPNGNTPGVNLVCNTGNWSLVSPWGTYSYDLSNPPNSSSASGNLVTSFYYNGLIGTGTSGLPGTNITGQPIPNVDTIVSDYTDNSQPQVWVDLSTIANIVNSSSDGTMITSWGCSVQAQSQVPSFQEPPGWPPGSNTSNLSWYSEPLNATVPCDICQGK